MNDSADTSIQPMDTFTAIRERRSVKQYDPAHVMPQEDIDRLLELAVLSPTSFNIQNWRFLVVRDKDLRRKICDAAWHQSQVTDASALILVCADLNAWDRQAERYWATAPAETRAALVSMIAKFYAGNAELQRDEAMRSAGMASRAARTRPGNARRYCANVGISSSSASVSTTFSTVQPPKPGKANSFGSPVNT